jgi:RND family efflux transporter MFP subunit
MNRHTCKCLSLFLMTPLLLSACSGEEETAVPDVVRPVKTLLIPSFETSGIRSFPARIESTRRAEVSFRVPGTINELPVKEGERIEQGQVIAKLDDTDYKLAVDDREAEFTRTEKDYERAKPLAEKGYVTLRERDRREAEMKSARAALTRAQKDLDYTTLKAPFSGEISNRLVQNFEEVQAKQPVVELRDVSALEVKFDVPEQIVLRIVDKAEREQAEPDVWAHFDAAPEKKYKLSFREFSTKADPATRTFEATFSLEAPSEITILPGMTANVTFDVSQFFDSKPVIYVPVEAIVSSNELSGRAWVVDETNMTVVPKDVKVGSLRGNSITVTEGLKPGDRVVVAGVPFLVNGMKVTLMPAQEQAEEREEDAQIRRNAEKQIKDADKAP